MEFICCLCVSEWILFCPFLFLRRRTSRILRRNIEKIWNMLRYDFMKGEMHMELKFRKKSKTILIWVKGEIDHHTSKELRQQTETALAQMGGRNIIYDFENVTFMDSSGIGMMIGRYKQLQVLGGRIAIANSNEKISEIIEISGLRKILPSYHSLEEAFCYVEGRDTSAV